MQGTSEIYVVPQEWVHPWEERELLLLLVVLVVQMVSITTMGIGSFIEPTLFPTWKAISAYSWHKTARNPNG